MSKQDAIDSIFAVEQEAYAAAIAVLKKRAEQSTTFALERALLDAAAEIEAMAKRAGE